MVSDPATYITVAAASSVDAGNVVATDEAATDTYLLAACHRYIAG